MIGRLHGVLAGKQPPWLLIDVAGVGYEVEAPMSTFYQLPATGQELTLLTHMVVREDAQLLYGFASENERQLFRSLIKVNSIGARLALTILSGIAADEFARAVQDSDTAALVRLPGIGKKTAERLVVEMRDRLDDWQSESTAKSGIAPVVRRSNAVQDAISALIALGYRPQEASRLVRLVDSDALESEMIIKAALKISVT